MENIDIINKAKQKLQQLKIPEYDASFEPIHKTLLGTGANSTVFKAVIDNIPMALKVMKIYYDTPFIYKFDNVQIITQTPFNELIISYILGKLSKRYITVQRFYGYQLTTQNITLYKEFCEYVFGDYIKDAKQDIVTNLIIHIILTLIVCFQQKYKGNHNDLKCRNILVKNTDKDHVSYNIDGTVIKLKLYGVCPVFTDFTSSVIYQYKDREILITRHDWKSFLKRAIKSKFNPLKDMITMFGDFRKNNLGHHWITRLFYDKFRSIKSPLDLINDPKIQTYINENNG